MNSATIPISITRSSRIVKPQAYQALNQPDLVAEGLLFWTLVLVPVWWILGIQLMVFPCVGWYLFYRSWSQPRRPELPFGWHLWLIYSGVWLLSIVYNLSIGVAELGRSVTALGSVVGIWLLTVAIWYAARCLNIRLQVVVRALCVVGLMQLLAVILGETHIAMTGTIVRTKSLITTLIPSMPAKVFFEAGLYGLDDVGWNLEPVPRLRSFYYWSPLAGTMSIIICMAALLERHKGWQGVGLAGGLVTVWLAAARAGQVGIVLALMVAIGLSNSRVGRRLLPWTVSLLTAFSPAILTALYRYFFEYRSDSAAGRLALYRETFQAFLQSPWIGYGTYGRSQVVSVPLGSHSQLFSTLYHTGLVGSGLVLVAWIALSLSILRLVWRFPVLSPCMGLWVGFSFQMVSGELSAASVTIFSVAALLGASWNQVEELDFYQSRPWLNKQEVLDQPTPWQSFGAWWAGTSTADQRLWTRKTLDWRQTR